MYTVCHKLVCEVFGPAGSRLWSALMLCAHFVCRFLALIWSLPLSNGYLAAKDVPLSPNFIIYHCKFLFGHLTHSNQTSTFWAMQCPTHPNSCLKFICGVRGTHASKNARSRTHLGHHTVIRDPWCSHSLISEKDSATIYLPPNCKPTQTLPVHVLFYCVILHYGF